MPPGDATAAPAAAERISLYVAIEVNQKNWMVGVENPTSKGIGLHSLGPADVEDLKDLIEKQCAKAEHQTVVLVTLAEGLTRYSLLICSGSKPFGTVSSLRRRESVLRIRVMVVRLALLGADGPFDLDHTPDVLIGVQF